MEGVAAAANAALTKMMERTPPPEAAMQLLVNELDRQRAADACSVREVAFSPLNLGPGEGIGGSPPTPRASLGTAPPQRPPPLWVVVTDDVHHLRIRTSLSSIVAPVAPPPGAKHQLRPRSGSEVSLVWAPAIPAAVTDMAVAWMRRREAAFYGAADVVRALRAGVTS